MTDRHRGCPTFRLLVRGSWGAPGLLPISIPKTKRPGACARPVIPELVAGGRFELTNSLPTRLVQMLQSPDELHVAIKIGNDKSA